MICSANQWTGLYMITAPVMKELKYLRRVKCETIRGLYPLTHFMPLLSLYTPWKQKTEGFLMLSERIEETSGTKWVGKLNRSFSVLL